MTHMSAPVSTRARTWMAPGTGCICCCKARRPVKLLPSSTSSTGPVPSRSGTRMVSEGILTPPREDAHGFLDPFDLLHQEWSRTDLLVSRCDCVQFAVIRPKDVVSGNQNVL